MPQQSVPKLSICIATYNRAEFLGATLQSIIEQVTDDCEIVVSDNASTDDTEAVVASYALRYEQLYYVRQPVNTGLDCNFDRAVMYAQGEYCWLMSDDDLVRPGAVARIAQELRVDLSLILANIEYRNADMSKILQRRSFGLESDRIYSPSEMDRLFSDLGDGVWYIGGVVIKRSIWVARERDRYYGSMFIHVAVIFQKSLPGHTLVIAEPLVNYRMGNTQTYTRQMGEILLAKWPFLVESLALSADARRKVRCAEPWRNPSWLLLLRGWGVYSITEYRSWVRPRLRALRERLCPVLIALLPGVLVNAMLVLYYSAQQERGRELQWMRRSRFHPRHWRLFARSA